MQDYIWLDLLHVAKNQKLDCAMTYCDHDVAFAKRALELKEGTGGGSQVKSLNFRELFRGIQKYPCIGSPSRSAATC